MNIQIFTLCEYAQSNNGKTTIVGTFNRIAPPVIPFVMPDIFVVVKMSFTQDTEAIASITLREKGGADVAKAGEIPLKIRISNGREAIHDIVLRINQVPFQKPGEYEVVFRLGDEEYTTNLYVDQADDKRAF